MMKDLIKQETTRLIYSLIFMAIIIGVMWYMYPKILANGGKRQARAFWKAEREANEERLFGGSD